jgi:hypothetical protein
MGKQETAKTSQPRVIENRTNVSNIHGFPIGDKGYLSQTLKQELQTFVIDLQTALFSNMHDSRPHWWVSLIVRAIVFM